MSRPTRFSSVPYTINGAHLRRAVATFMLVVAASFVSVPAFAQGKPLDGPRANGIVGERFDGFAFLVDPAAPATIQQLVDQVNAERRNVYNQRAQAEGVTIDAVGRIYAAQIFQSAPAGTIFLQESGQSVRK
jgi:uncharacterized protein YdbL (DUF1318 family)